MVIQFAVQLLMAKFLLQLAGNHCRRNSRALWKWVRNCNWWHHSHQRMEKEELYTSWLRVLCLNVCVLSLFAQWRQANWESLCCVLCPDCRHLMSERRPHTHTHTHWDTWPRGVDTSGHLTGIQCNLLKSLHSCSQLQAVAGVAKSPNPRCRRKLNHPRPLSRKRRPRANPSPAHPRTESLP